MGEWTSLCTKLQWGEKLKWKTEVNLSIKVTKEKRERERANINISGNTNTDGYLSPCQYIDSVVMWLSTLFWAYQVKGALLLLLFFPWWWRESSINLRTRISEGLADLRNYSPGRTGKHGTCDYTVLSFSLNLFFYPFLLFFWFQFPPLFLWMVHYSWQTPLKRKIEILWANL